ncbi:kinase domain-containing protein [Xylaria cf. heliscus]|nr:kinase domain-containing protein [Xylaria cf. heliscus]
MSQTSVKSASAISELAGLTGRRYLFKELIQDRPHMGRLWLATSGTEKFVLKDIPKDIFSNSNDDIRPRLREHLNIRLPSDTIRDQRIFVYRHFDDDFMSLVRKEISLRARKQILKASLQGLAELHDRDIVHLGKENPLFPSTRVPRMKTAVEEVQLSDLENAAYLPKGRCIKGMLAGNDNWRCPEGHFKGALNKPSDMFSFGVVCIYAILRRPIFEADADLHTHEARGALPVSIRLQRQVSYFGTRDSVDGLAAHVGDEGVNGEVLDMLWADRAADYHSYRPFREWADVGDGGAGFEDLVLGMVNLDPAKRITARRALEHPWFTGVGGD